LLGNDDPFANKSGKYWKIKSLIKKLQFNNASAVTNISSVLARQCISFGIHEEKVFIIPRTIQKSKTYKKSFKERTILKALLLQGKNPYPVLLFAGVLIKRKGIDIVYETFKILLKKFPDAHLVFAGPMGARGQQTPMNEIKENIIQEGIENHITITGYVKNIQDYLNIADVFFFPSRNEGFGRVFIEAMACGVPVIAKEIPGITDYIFDNGENGLIIDSEDPKKYAQVVEQLVADKDLSEKVSRKASITVQNRFTEDVVYEQYTKLFDFALRTDQKPKY
jgi:glycosyltransferase involved in cell wall biosynthesis